MKRLDELEQAVIEIVDEGKTKDEEGHALYPVMEEPMVMAFFGAYNTLYETLRERPIMVLNLIRTNKALEMFWGMFEGMWIKMIDNILEREVNRRFADTYPFFAIANHRARQIVAPLLGEINLDKYPNVRHYGDADFLKRRLFESEPFNYPGKVVGTIPYNKTEAIYQVIYYDPVTKLYIQLLQLVYNLQLEYNENNTRLKFIVTTSCLEEYIHWDSVNRNIDCLDDCFVINITEGPKILQYGLDYMLFRVRMIIRRIEEHSILSTLDSTGKREIRYKDVSMGYYPRIVVDMFQQVDRLAGRLLRILESHFDGRAPLVQVVPTPIELDKALATPYYTLLYDKDQGIYNTPDKQRTLLMAVLRNANSSLVFGENMVKKYGQGSPLNCVVCHSETHSVDLLLMRAFCTDECRSIHTQNK